MIPFLRPSPRTLAPAFALLAALLPLTACESSAPVAMTPFAFDHTWRDWAHVLALSATEQGVRYDRIAQEDAAARLEVAARQVSSVSPLMYESFSPEQRLCFLINAHNIHAARRIVRVWPVESLDAGRIFGSAVTEKSVDLLGRKTSLLEIRERVMGVEFYESRSIFLLNWGMRGCAPLAAAPATPLNLEDLLEMRTREFVRNPAYNRYEVFERRLETSPLLRDYREDLERDYTTLWGFIRHFAAPDTAAQIERDPPKFIFRDFDTSLNLARVPKTDEN